ncbi:MAG: VOC family protein [Zetaproteobacteria bacterium]|nr:VOC family protein [Zetaproteobacteria bacterium]
MKLGLNSYHSYEHYVTDLSRTQEFYEKVLGYKTIGNSTPAAEKKDGMQRLVLTAGRDINVVLSKPLTEWSVAAKYLSHHPEGVGALNFRVDSLELAYNFLEERNATFLYAPVTETTPQGIFKQFAIATPLADVCFRFIEDTAFQGFSPAFAMTEQPGEFRSEHHYECIDHITSNVKSLQPLVAFFKDVMAFETFWGIAFHTNDINPDLPVGSGLKSAVMWDPTSGIKFANNEPSPPYFRNSQIDIYLNDNHGAGVQHIALRVPRILPVMHKLKSAGGQFLPAPASYYAQTPERLKESGFTGKVSEPLADLEQHSILVDASEKGYLLQIFSLVLGRHYGDTPGGPLFYEVIQREGDDGFGGGNFRALFETIEVDQIALEKTAQQLPLETI